MNLFQGAFREGLRRLLEVRQLLDDAKGAAPERRGDGGSVVVVPIS